MKSQGERDRWISVLRTRSLGESVGYIAVTTGYRSKLVNGEWKHFAGTRDTRWLGGLVVTALDLRLDGRKFDSRPPRLVLGWATVFGRAYHVRISPSHHAKGMCSWSHDLFNFVIRKYDSEHHAVNDCMQMHCKAVVSCQIKLP